MFYYDRGLKLSGAELSIDIARRQGRGFISHAHGDHMARHEYALCTPATARLYQLRYGRRDVLEMPYRQPLEWGNLQLTTFPAGHCLGSAMLLVEQEKERLLYTGDFKLAPSLTCAPAELPLADTLIMESTFGDPAFRLPPRDDVVAELIEAVRRALDRGYAPVVRAYTVGKAQEVTRLLSDAGIEVLQHPLIFRVSQVYQALGVDLGQHEVYPGYWRYGHAVVIPPAFHRPAGLDRLNRPWNIAVTGWALTESARRRWWADECVPLSDHADFDELLEAVGRVSPKTVYCTHGPPSFVDHLRAAGFNAHRLEVR